MGLRGSYLIVDNTKTLNENFKNPLNFFNLNFFSSVKITLCYYENSSQNSSESIKRSNEGGVVLP